MARSTPSASADQPDGVVPAISQGVQFISAAFVDTVQGCGAKAMDGKGRWMDNMFIERLWRSVKCEAVQLEHGFRSGLVDMVSTKYASDPN